jgi:hypothetical protein
LSTGDIRMSDGLENCEWVGEHLDGAFEEMMTDAEGLMSAKKPWIVLHPSS